jgi:hypothetical protein
MRKKLEKMVALAHSGGAGDGRWYAVGETITQEPPAAAATTWLLTKLSASPAVQPVAEEPFTLPCRHRFERILSPL